MDVRALRYFVEVVRQQSFTRAAEQLYVTQPTISKMLRQLEDELGCTLLIREGRKLHLTDTGQAVYQRGMTILQEFKQLEAEISDINDLKTGELRLGIRQCWDANCRIDFRFPSALSRGGAEDFRIWRADGAAGGAVRQPRYCPHRVAGG